MKQDGDRKSKGSEDDNNVWMVVAKYFGLMTAVPAAIFIGYLIGAGLDHYFDTRYLKIVFSIVGTAAGFLPIIKDLNRDIK